jgi:hypothetical protein
VAEESEQPAEPAKVRNPDGTWPKGISGNPKGGKRLYNDQTSMGLMFWRIGIELCGEAEIRGWWQRTLAASKLTNREGFAMLRYLGDRIGGEVINWIQQQAYEDLAARVDEKLGEEGKAGAD